MILTSEGLGEVSRNVQPACLLRIASHPHQGAQAPGIAESHHRRVHYYRPGATAYDSPDITDRHLGADDI